MGVPAFFRWISEKYPKITVRCIEEEAPVFADGSTGVVDATQDNPNNLEFDNLYLDMNGIIHPCTHPEDGSLPLTQSQMFLAIGNHIDRLFRLIRPRKLVYMAIDGIAPRAKMNQQRSRRFRSAQEADEAREDREKVRRAMNARGMGLAKTSDSSVPNFDSNVITPGTEFMDTLAEYLRYFILERQQNDAAWKSCKVILSDSQSPGEGEHKIMQFIRRQRAEVGHDPNCHHVMYGLDADLIMLGLASHEVHFTVLRDWVPVGKQNRNAGVKKDSVLMDVNEPSLSSAPAITISKLKPIEMLHVWILREYLQHEFREESFSGGRLPFAYDFERCIDDFVFLCFFVGNDFLPHLPTLSIRESGLELLLNIYRRVLPTLEGYLTEEGDINLARVGALLKDLGAVEDAIFEKRSLHEAADKRRKAQQLANKNRNAAPPPAPVVAAAQLIRGNFAGPPPLLPDANKLAALALKAQLAGPPPAPSKEKNQSVAEALRANLKKSSGSPVLSEDDESSDESEEKFTELEDKVFDDTRLDFESKVKKIAEQRNMGLPEEVDEIKFGTEGWKDRYYVAKFGPEVNRRKVVESYVRGLAWVIQYYYQGCQSWKFYYEYHYAPFASDLTNLEDIEITWPLSRPFKPFEQLMAVLPPQSAHALPIPCQAYMTDEDSEIADFYPRTLQFDANGKGNLKWLWVCVLPFIDENRLLKVTSRCEEEFTDDEKRRNALMPDLLFVGKTSPGCGAIQQVLEMSPPNTLLHNWESDQLALIQQKSKLFESALSLPAPTTAGDVRGGGRDEVYLSAPQGGGLAGFFFPLSQDFAVKIGQDVKTKFGTIKNSSSLVCEFRLPPMLPHLSSLCEGVTIPKSVLSAQDLQVKRIPDRNAVNVSLLVPDNSNSGLERSWGSMEPEAKRYQGGNPLMQQQQQQQQHQPIQSYASYPTPSSFPPYQQQQQQPQHLTPEAVEYHLQTGLNVHIAHWNNAQAYPTMTMPPPPLQGGQWAPSYAPAPPHYQERKQ